MTASVTIVNTSNADGEMVEVTSNDITLRLEPGESTEIHKHNSSIDVPIRFYTEPESKLFYDDEGVQVFPEVEVKFKPNRSAR